MSSFDLRRLRYFVAVAELGSVTRAASELHVAQPALSYQIRLLEEEVGGELFARGPQGVRLTELGTDLAEESRRLLGDIKALRNRLNDRAGDPEGEVVVGLAQTIGPVLAVPLLELAAKKLPRVRIHIRELMSSDIPELLRSESIDFALSYAIPSGRGVHSVNVFSEDLFLFGTAKSAKNFFARADISEVRFADLKNVPLYLSSRSNGFREALEGIARKRKTPLNVAAEIDSVSIRKDIALHGAGFTILSGATICKEIHRRDIFAARITHPPIRRKICFVRRTGGAASRAGKAVAALIGTALAGVATSEKWPGAVLPDAIPKLI